MRSVEKSAKTYEEAVTAALTELDAAISDVDIQVLEEGSKGLFGLFGSRPTKIRVTLKAQEAEDDLLDLDALLDKKPEPKPAPKAEKKPASKPADEKKPVEDKKPTEEKKPAAKPAEEKKPAVKPVEEKKPTAKPAEEKKPLPEPVRRTAPKAESKKQPKPEAPATEAAEKPETAAEAKPESPKASAAEKPARPPRQRKPRQPKADKPEQPAEEKKPLPPKAPAKPLEKPVVTMLEADQVDPESAPGKAQAFLKELTHLMGVDVEIAVGTDTENNVFVQMTGDTLGVLIGRRGETLDALQYLTSLRVNRGQEGYTRVTLDTENYRAKREDTLIRLANRMANRAVKTGRKVSMEPMNPYERRIIHSALQSNEAVDTHSEGEDPNRHVVITLRK